MLTRNIVWVFDVLTRVSLWSLQPDRIALSFSRKVKFTILFNQVAGCSLVSRSLKHAIYHSFNCQSLKKWFRIIEGIGKTYLDKDASECGRCSQCCNWFSSVLTHLGKNSVIGDRLCLLIGNQCPLNKIYRHLQSIPVYRSQFTKRTPGTYIIIRVDAWRSCRKKRLLRCVTFIRVD